MASSNEFIFLSDGGSRVLRRRVGWLMADVAFFRIASFADHTGITGAEFIEIPWGAVGIAGIIIEIASQRVIVD